MLGKTNAMSSAAKPSGHITNADIANFETEILANEPFTHNGGLSEKYTINSRGATANGMLWARINPTYDTQFAGEIIGYFDSIPEGATSVDVYYSINGVNRTKTSATINAETNSFTIPFSTTAAFVANSIKIELDDTDFADKTLTYLQLNVTHGANFACLNRDNQYKVLTQNSTSNKQYVFLTKNLGNTQELKYLYKYYTNE